MPIPSPAIELHNVDKVFGSTAALREVDLRIEPGGCTVLVGESGCGKSTLLRLLIGLQRADCGTIEVLGENPAGAAVADIRRRTGYVIQNGGLFPHLNARDNVTLAAQALAWPMARQQARLDELLALTQLDAALLDRRPDQLSGGQRQRVALMRALFLDPDLLLLDEPLGALDPIIRRDLQEELKTLIDTMSKTVVMVTHDLPEAVFFSDDIAVMAAGRIIQRGSYEMLRQAPTADYVARFIHAPRNLPA